MRLFVWNVNGIRPFLQRGNFKDGLAGLFAQFHADVVCFQETKVTGLDKLSDDLVDVPGYDSFWNFSQTRAGWSGVVTYARTGSTQTATSEFLGEPDFDLEGRCIMTDHADFVLLNVYFPNGGMGPHRVEFKLRFYDAMKFRGSTGCLPDERQKLTDLLDIGFVDAFRHFSPDSQRQFTFWDMRTMQRPFNNGWRIDYFYVSSGLVDRVTACDILASVQGSDHCPITLDLADMGLRSDLPVPPTAASLRKKPKKNMSIHQFFKPVQRQPAAVPAQPLDAAVASQDTPSKLSAKRESSTQDDGETAKRTRAQ
ncbi:Endonuclease/exonuclease/phosphatase [Entophlyctis helioformis]|nr:Endonuclease/exonuclease/phosphatase [Entophlyctis helioformis]